MHAEYDLARLGWPEQIDRFTELLCNVWQDHVPVDIIHNGTVVAVAVNPDDIDLLRRQVGLEPLYQSDESRPG